LTTLKLFIAICFFLMLFFILCSRPSDKIGSLQNRPYWKCTKWVGGGRRSNCIESHCLTVVVKLGRFPITDTVIGVKGNCLDN